MRKKLFSLLLGSFVCSSYAADFAPTGREGIEWCDIWISHANESKLPRVLLLGDSITRAYYSEVEKRLAGKAYVSRLATSAFISDPAILAQIAAVLEQTKFDIIHFNNGMHGWQHSEEEYRHAFPEFFATIQKHAPGAKLIWASTTPIRENAPPAEANQNPNAVETQKLMLKQDLTRASNQRIEARNAIALEFAKAHRVAVDDLYAAMAGHPEYHPEKDGIHFNAQGVALQADQVAAAVSQALGGK